MAKNTIGVLRCARDRRIIERAPQGLFYILGLSMSSMTFSTNYRPLRIGFCIDAGSLVETVRAAELNTLLVGGRYNPIIPVDSADDKIGTQLVKLFQLDFLYQVGTGTHVKEFVESNKHLSTLALRDDLLFVDDDGAKKLRVLDIGHILDLQGDRLKGGAQLPTWATSDPLDALFAMHFGRFPTIPALAYDYAGIYKNALKPSVPALSSTTSLTSETMTKIGPLSLTGWPLELHGRGWGWKYHGIYVGRHDSQLDLLNYWNLRAAGIKLLFVPLDFMGLYASAARGQAKHVLAWDSKQKFPNGVGIWHDSSIDQAVVMSAIKTVLPKGKKLVVCRVDEHLWNGHNLKPSEPVFGRKTVLATVDQKYGAPSVTLQLPDMPTANESRAGDPAQAIGFMVNPLSEFEYEGYTLKLPYLPDLNNWFGREAGLALEDVRVGQRDFTLVVDTHDSVATFRPIQLQALISRIFERSEIKISDSQPGLIARRLIEQMGGGLEDCRVFKLPGVRKLIGSLKPGALISRSEAKRIIRDEDANGHASIDDHAHLYIQARDGDTLKADEVFDFMLARRLLRPGLQPECSSCHLKPWLPIDSLANDIECEYCGSRFDLTVQLRDRDWRYRKSGLLGSDNHQEGAIPVILTLLQFLRRSHHHQLAYTLAIKLFSRARGVNCEVDFAILDADIDAIPTIAIGEAKTGDEITDDDISNLSAVKAALERDGVKVYLVISKTRDFTSDEIARFKKLDGQGEFLILLTQRELEPYDLYDYYHKKGIKLPQIYGSSFADLARNSHTAYLN